VEKVSSARPPASRQTGSTARAKSAAFRAAEQARERRKRMLLAVAAVVVVAAVVGGIAAGVAASGKKSHGSASGASDVASATLTGPPGPEVIPLEQGTVLAPASTAADGQTVDGIQCQSNEQVAYHIHTHLSVYVNGALRPLPAGIGIVNPVAQQTPNGAFYEASQCYYWLHVHAQDGVIHVEAPNRTTYTLGQFFGIWRQPLTATQVGPAHGKVTAYVNGVRYTGDPAAIPLQSHEDVQVDVGTVVAPKKIDWSQAQL
jgi:hypothetical protein